MASRGYEACACKRYTSRSFLLRYALVVPQQYLDKSRQNQYLSTASDTIEAYYQSNHWLLMSRSQFWQILSTSCTVGNLLWAYVSYSGRAHAGDSYLVLHTEKNGPSKTYDLHFWLGSSTSQVYPCCSPKINLRLDFAWARC